MKNIQEIDVLGYHKMGEYKWKELGIKNEFEKVDTPTADEVKLIKKRLIKNLGLNQKTLNI